MPYPDAFANHPTIGLRCLRAPLANMKRDMAIALAVEKACEAGGLHRSRNAESRTVCGCSIVSDALAKIGVHVTTDAVAKACQRAKQFT
jgi:hypothetical protein